jgi:tRNA threonylcarbamoyladenosine biosynthesis protein TsaB
VAVLRDESVLALSEHEAGVDYSSWLLPAVTGALAKAGVAMGEVDGYVVASGPGSFTGVRVGLTTVKGWVEVYGKPVAAVSRLEAIAEQVSVEARCVAALVDAQRGQVFGGVYRREGASLTRIGEEMVISPGLFVEEAVRLVKGEEIRWVSTDPAHVLGEAAWKEREKAGESIQEVSATLAGVIGRIGARRLREGQSTDALGLDANYVRRSDAEIFWKSGRASHGG